MDDARMSEELPVIDAHHHLWQLSDRRARISLVNGVDAEILRPDLQRVNPFRRNRATNQRLCLLRLVHTLRVQVGKTQARGGEDSAPPEAAPSTPLQRVGRLSGGAQRAVSQACFLQQRRT